jgi:arylsulfatase
MMVYRDYGVGYRGNLNDSCVTFGEVLRAAGYQTMLAGKWHAGHELHSRPEVRGFDRFTGVYPHIDSYWKVLEGCDIYRDREIFIGASENPVNPYNPDDEFYTTDFFTDNALDYIDEALEDKSKPFLLHVCYNAPHFPLEAPDYLVEKYRGRYTRGWDKLREEKFERMKDMGIVTKGQKLPQVSGFDRQKRTGFDYQVTAGTDYLPKWDSLSEEDRRELDFRRAIYAAQVDRLDQNVGRIVEHLRKRGILDNTLILFFSDNGCSGELGRFGMNWGEYTSNNYNEWRKRSGWSISQGQCWASYSNTPLRKYKIFVHEGGIASPFIAHWPTGIRESGRIVKEQIFHLMDVMPTLCHVTGAAYPETYGSRKITRARGVSMLPFIRTANADVEERTLYWQHETHAAIREGDWKLVSSNDRDEKAWELYDLAKDRSESEDLSEQHPEIIQRLREKWRHWAAETHVLPYPEERGNPKHVLWPPSPWPEE